MHTTGSRPKLVISADGHGVVSHAGSRLLADLADGGEAIADLALLRDQREVFGPIASTPTAWRVLADIDPATLATLGAARATARKTAWLQAADTRCGIPPSRAGGRDLPGLVLDLDATLIWGAPTGGSPLFLRLTGRVPGLVPEGVHIDSASGAGRSISDATVTTTAVSQLATQSTTARS